VECLGLILYAIGYFIIFIGVLYSFIVIKNLTSGDVSIILSTVFGGVIFLALGKIVEILEKIEKKLPERKYTEEFPITEFSVRSNDFEVYDSNNETYKYFTLNGNEFIQARVFKNYIDIKETDFEYKLPNRNEIKLTVYKEYSPIVDMFSRDEIIFVKLSSLNISLLRRGNKITLSYY
jgi:hypothetical protein